MSCELVFPPEPAGRAEIRRRLRDALVAAGEMPVWREIHARPGGWLRRLRRSRGVEIRQGGRRVWAGRNGEVPAVEELTLGLRAMAELPARRRFRPPAFTSMVPTLALVLLPKCPVCWAALMASGGVAGLSSMPYQPWLLPTMTGLLAVSLLLFRVGPVRRSGPFWLAVVGAALTLVARFVLEMGPPAYAGAAMIAAAALWSTGLRHAEGIRRRGTSALSASSV